MQPLADDSTRVAALREALPSTAAGIGLDVLGAGPLPAETARAMAEADEWDLRTGRSGVDRNDDVAQREAEACGVLAALLGAQPDEILLTGGVRAAIRLAEWICGETGRTIRTVRHLDRATGRTLSTDALGGVAAEAGRIGAPWLLDAGDTAGAMPLRAAETGAQFVAVAGDRWLLGPEGTGGLWVDPIVFGSHGVPTHATLGAARDPLPRRSVLGLARSVGWLEMYVGLPWLHARTSLVARTLRERLAGIDGVELATPVDDPGAVAVFLIRGWLADEAGRELGARCFAVLGPAADAEHLRVSVGAWNTEDEIERLSRTVALLAAHDSTTLPQRPGLTVLGPGDRL